MSRKKEKLLYIMGIDWDWIYQRPQIMEQHLEELYDVTVVFPRSILKRKNKKANIIPYSYKILWTLPFQEKNKLIGWFSNKFNKKIFNDCNKYKIIFIGYPLYYRYIPYNYIGKILYDCMDNYEYLYPYQKGVDKVLYQEKKLANNCDYLLATSQKLKQKMDSLVQIDKAVLVRNGTQINNLCIVEKAVLKEKYQIGYFGTISEWFDYDLLLKSLEKFYNIEYQLIGPTVGDYKNQNERIKFHGAIEHSKLYDYIKDYDCLIMPFIVNDIVKWVDPVKLYEYISMGKCIVSVYYEEIERFDKFVYFYNNEEEYIALIRELLEKGFPPKYSVNEQKDFLKENSWDARFQILDAMLNSN